MFTIKYFQNSTYYLIQIPETQTMVFNTEKLHKLTNLLNKKALLHIKLS